ncbi:MAG: glycosyltransferase family 39 protein [bacterium]|nr:glycosyltransferase family 39 protein [bacterium]
MEKNIKICKKAAEKIMSLKLYILIITGIILRVYCLSCKSFWCDEFLAISLSKIPEFSDMIRWIIKNDAHPPLFYSVIRIIFHFTNSEFGLRFMPFLFGAFAIIIFYKLLKEVDIKNYLLPLSLFIFSPAQVLWSQIVKSYSTLTFFSLLSIFTFIRYKKTNKNVYATWWILSSIITLYLHNYGMLIIAAQVIILLLYRKEISFRKFIIPYVIIFLFYLPYLSGPLVSQIAFVKTAPHSILNPFLRIVYTFFYFLFGETLSPLNFKFVIPGILLFFIFFIIGLRKEKNILQKFSSIVIILGIILIFSVKATIPQNLIHLQPFFFIIVASGVECLKKAKVKILFSFFLLLCLMPSLYYYYTNNSLQYHDVSKLIPYKKITETITREETIGEVIIMNEGRETRFTEFFEPYSPWDWYYKGHLPIKDIHNADELEKIYKIYNGFWVILKYNRQEQNWDEDIKNFFVQRKSVKIKEMKLIKNYSFLDVLKGQEKKEYYFIEVYHFIKK